ncbi:lysozyme [Streptomyces actinomycinicus]|uniref:Lysozyme n=1 Tax=Streptomyces actinomycinicus TaxID=1695166 RepID=A0A937EN53_9ACTN|nr:lysozyme [Streptomyces actinomycinicus]MBL1086377.1 lysozyme [Streptomyces actinomycinicus]
MVRRNTLARRRAGVLAAATAALALAGTAPATAGYPQTQAQKLSRAEPQAQPGVPGGAAEAGGAPRPGRALRALPKGHDVSSHQEDVDWSAARATGARFVYIKATESTDYRNPYFSEQYADARKARLFRGAYHFALPDRSGGARQAAYFLRHGGDRRADGWTLPPALDIEYNPYSDEHRCYGLSRSRMVRWIRSFSDEIKRETGRRPVIYTTSQWWKQCTGDSRAFSSSHALWIARHGTSRPGSLPGGWRYWTFWQYRTEGALPGDQNLFNGSVGRLRALARGH